MKIVACISRENKELYGIKRNYKYRILFLDVAKRQEYYGDPSLITNKKTCGYGKSIVSPLLKYIAAGGDFFCEFGTCVRLA